MIQQQSERVKENLSVQDVLNRRQYMVLGSGTGLGCPQRSYPRSRETSSTTVRQTHLQNQTQGIASSTSLMQRPPSHPNNMRHPSLLMLLSPLINLSQSFSLPRLQNTTVHVDPPFDPSEIEEDVCVFPDKLPSWAGLISTADCKDAWSEIDVILSPMGGKAIEWTFWWGQPPRGEGPNLMRSPVEAIHRTCHVSVMLIAQITPALIPPVLQPPGTVKRIDKATFGDIKGVGEMAYWCVENRGVPGAFTTGIYDGLGVFMWSNESEISKLYRQRNGKIGLSGTNVVFDPSQTS